MSVVYEDRVEEIIEATHDYLSKGSCNRGRELLHGIDAAAGILDMIERHRKTDTRWSIIEEDVPEE